MRHSRKPLWSAALLLTCTVHVLAQSGAPYALAPAPRKAQAVAQAREMLLTVMTERKLPGVAITVGIDNQIVWSEGFGFADVENRVAVTPLTKFRIGSVSKPITTAALGVLIEQKKIALDAPVQQYVPAFPKKKFDLTPRQLAGHTAGIRHYRGDEFYSKQHYASVVAGLTIFQDDTLLFKPGERYSYSSYGFNLLSAALEAAAGQDFLSYVRAQVLEPLGMRNTVADHNDSLIVFRARFYERDEHGNLLNAPFVDNSYKWAGGGFLSTTEDLVRFGAAHLQAGFLKKETLALLLTAQKTSDAKATGYGYGWAINQDEQGRAWFGHGGGSVGGTAYLIVYPAQKVVLALLTNIGNAGWQKLPQNLALLFI